VLSLRGIRRRFVQGGVEIEPLKGIDLDLPPGTLVALVGPSGTGKSTLMHIAGLLERPTAGEVLIDGQPCSNLPDADRTRLRRERIGFVYQFHHLLPDFTALENVMLPRLVAGEGRGEARRRAEALLGRLGLASRLTHRPARLSAASSSASPSPGRSPTTRACCWPTSPPATSTPRPPRPSSPSSSSRPRDRFRRPHRHPQPGARGPHGRDVAARAGAPGTGVGPPRRRPGWA
jgi:lipoprotein-releasing system ATP-binding protein